MEELQEGQRMIGGRARTARRASEVTGEVEHTEEDAIISFLAFV